MKTIAQQLNIKSFPFKINDDNGNEIYYENSNGIWYKCEYDSAGNRIYAEESDGFWIKCEYDSAGNEIYFEHSDGVIEDNRVTEVTLDDIAAKFGVNVKNLKVKK